MVVAVTVVVDTVVDTAAVAMAAVDTTNLRNSRYRPS